MNWYTVEHDAAPFMAMIRAADVYDAARQYKAGLELALQSEIEEGELLTVDLVTVENGAVSFEGGVQLEWLEAIRNFKKVGG